MMVIWTWLNRRPPRPPEVNVIDTLVEQSLTEAQRAIQEHRLLIARARYVETYLDVLRRK